MKATNEYPAMGSNREQDYRDRFARLKVLVADRDQRTASLVQRILFSFGFRHLDVTTSGEKALAHLKERRYDLIITEWNMLPMNGVALVRAIRSAKEAERMRRDIPIIMLTARSDMLSVEAARDAGITEFVAKPFSARTISNRIIQIIDNPRVFIESEGFAGPDRRRRGEAPGNRERRGQGDSRQTPANRELSEQLGDMSAAEILTEEVIAAAQAELLKAEDDFIGWARKDLLHLQVAFRTLEAQPGNGGARRSLIEASYAIQSQAGIFGYAMGTEVAKMLTDYCSDHTTFSAKQLTVVKKHIDAIHIIFREKIKATGHGIARDTMLALKRLTQKLG